MPLLNGDKVVVLNPFLRNEAKTGHLLAYFVSRRKRRRNGG
jgi:hypothetical protein